MSARNIFQIFLMEHGVLRDQFDEMLYDLVDSLVRKRLYSNILTGSFSCLFTAKQLKTKGGSQFFFVQDCPRNVTLNELHPTCIMLINGSEAFIEDSYRVTRSTSLTRATAACSMWCGGRDCPSSHAVPIRMLKSLWLGNVVHDQKCLYNFIWSLLKKHSEKGSGDILWAHTCSVHVFSEGAPSSLQIFLNSPGSCRGPVAELRRMMEEGWRGTDPPHGETQSLHWRWLNSRKQGSRAGCQGWERAIWVEKGTLTKSVFFPRQVKQPGTDGAPISWYSCA